MNDKEFALSTLESLKKLMGDAEHLRLLYEQGDYTRFEQHAENMLLELKYFRYMQENGIDSVIDSLKRIIVHAKEKSSKTVDKIEFELLPLMRVVYNIYYFYYCVYPDKASMEKYYQQEMHLLGSNKYINDAVKTGQYKYDISVAVIAFNKLEYTKQCVESILKHIPQGLNYELILINHGSTDGTKEYFESVSPTKQLDIAVNGGGLAAYTSICEGKYFLLVSNDVLVTENAIANMIRCMESDEKIAWVVPTTPHVSNRQAIPAKYSTIDEMHAFASENNRCSDPYRWEQRTRLVDPISLRRSSVSFSSSGVNWAYYLYTKASGGFSDDKEALLYRRNGYKMMLAKDSYCHHFGSVTLKDELAGKESFYDEGRKAFYDAFGVDPWGTGFCWSPELMSLLSCRQKGLVNILGLNCGLGSNPLKIKETLKERAHNLDVTLYNVTDDKHYAQDLQGLSDVFAHERHSRDFHKLFPGVRFNYIVFESNLETCREPRELIENLKGRLTSDGVLILQTADPDIKKSIARDHPRAVMRKDWCVIPGKERTGHSHDRDLARKGGGGSRDRRTREQQIESLLQSGERIFSRGDLGTAVKIFESVLRLDKSNSQALNNLGVIQWQLGETASAVNTFQIALEFNLQDPDALANLLQAAKETGRFDLIKPDLLDSLQQALPENPDLRALINAQQEK